MANKLDTHWRDDYIVHYSRNTKQNKTLCLCARLTVGQVSVLVI